MPSTQTQFSLHLYRSNLPISIQKQFGFCTLDLFYHLLTFLYCEFLKLDLTTLPKEIIHTDKTQHTYLVTVS